MHEARVVIGVGTGLGVAALKRSDAQCYAVPSEAGHATFAPVSDVEISAARLAHQDLGMASWESVLSGPGIERRYRAHQQGGTSHDIVQRAQGGDALCVAIVGDLCQTLARFASDAALWFNATGGVYLAGGLLHDLLPWLHDDVFASAFANKGVMSDFLEDIPVSLIVADQPGLIGAAVGAHSLSVPASRVPASHPATEITQ